jgi:hypothetical protein
MDFVFSSSIISRAMMDRYSVVCMMKRRNSNKCLYEKFSKDLLGYKGVGTNKKQIELA